MGFARRRRFRTISGAATVGMALLVAACGCASSSSSTASSAAANPSTTTGAPSAAAAGVAIGTTKGADGLYLTGGSGRALYLWVADSNGKSSCSGACAQAWPPVITKATPVASTGVNAGDLGSITRSDGSQQVTYKGHPLYYFIADRGVGTTKGQGSDSFGAKWWLVDPAGSAIVAGGQSTAAGSSGGSSHSSTSGGWA